MASDGYALISTLGAMASFITCHKMERVQMNWVIKLIGVRESLQNEDDDYESIERLSISLKTNSSRVCFCSQNSFMNCQLRLIF